MSNNHNSNDSTKTEGVAKNQPLPLLVWQEPAKAEEKNLNKIVDMEIYRRSQEPVSEATIMGWELSSYGSIKPVRLIMVSSGFAHRSLGKNTIQSMAA
jgi:hypothetical protein